MSPLASWSLLIAVAGGLAWWLSWEFRNAPLIDDPRCTSRRDDHFADCVCPGCDEGPDDLMDVAWAVGVVVSMQEPLTTELAKSEALRNMPIDDAAEWLATAREIDHLWVAR